MLPLLQLLRVKQWTKNLFLFLPVFFAGEAGKAEVWPALVLGFLAFSLVSSAVYIVNDWLDVDRDRLHPKKRSRPLAAGTVSGGRALALAATLAAAGAAAAWFAGIHFFYIAAIYIVINVLYSLALKHIPVLDILIVGSGFLLRIFAGGVLAGVYISSWIVLVTFLLALFLALAKRRDDLVLLEESGVKARKAVDGYSFEFINAGMAVMAAVVIVAYIMYTTSAQVVERIGSGNLYLTSVFVIAGVLKYLQLTLVEQRSGDPARLLFSDRFLQLVILGWLLSFYFILY